MNNYEKDIENGEIHRHVSSILGNMPNFRKKKLNMPRPKAKAPRGFIPRKKTRRDDAMRKMFGL